MGRRPLRPTSPRASTEDATALSRVTRPRFEGSEGGGSPYRPAQDSARRRRGSPDIAGPMAGPSGLLQWSELTIRVDTIHCKCRAAEEITCCSNSPDDRARILIDLLPFSGRLKMVRGRPTWPRDAIVIGPQAQEILANERRGLRTAMSDNWIDARASGTASPKTANLSLWLLNK